MVASRAVLGLRDSAPLSTATTIHTAHAQQTARYAIELSPLLSDTIRQVITGDRLHGDQAIVASCFQPDGSAGPSIDFTVRESHFPSPCSPVDRLSC